MERWLFHTTRSKVSLNKILKEGFLKPNYGFIVNNQGYLVRKSK